MGFIARIRFYFALLVFLLYCIISACHLYLLWGWCIIARTSPSIKRRRAGNWRSWWSHFAFSTVGRIMKFEVVVQEEVRGKTASLSRPCIIVSNHQSSMDILLVGAISRKLGLKDVRWILKEELKHKSLFIGHSCIMDGSAFVRRKGGERDLRSVADCAKRLEEDAASIVIFPEGTRFRPERLTDEYKKLLPPKPAGFGLLREHVPGHDVLSLTLDWGARDKTRTIGQLGALYGSKITVTWSLTSAEEVAPDWLVEEWGRKDRFLSNQL